MEILDRQAATLHRQLADVAALLESRLGESDEMTVSARAAEEQFAALAHRIHRHVALSNGDAPLESKSHTA